MRNKNPLFIPTNQKIQEALEAEEQNNMKPFKKNLQKLLKEYEI